jgi:hypothetical protein
MSTRANIILKESYSYRDTEEKEIKGLDQLIFYRHSDGYPEGALPTLNIFMRWLKDGKIRNNLTQSSGWLILLGAIEYNTIPEFKTGKDNYGLEETIKEPKDWKCGAYEPTTEIHGDIEYLYEIDLTNKILIVKKVNWDYKTNVISYTEIKDKNYENL